ncbi:MAG: ABC transporter substrate-binding protein [Vallitalea sp.]|jgi:fructooligosaccharide transport system substrate-binding protein|nr:ABC transporter substrate-binding protein [Vallitalea sp.]
MQKKFVSLLLVILLVSISIIGCGEKNTNSDTPTSKDNTEKPNNEVAKKKQEKIIIDIFPDLWPDKMMKSLEAAGLADMVEFRETPQNQYESKIRMMIAGGEIGDLICIDAPNIAYYANMGSLEALDDYWDQSDFDDLVPSAQTAMQYNGSKWAAPLNESSVVLYYNKEMFEEAGITPAKTLEESWTFDQVLDAAKKLTKKDDSGNIIRYGILPTMFTPNNRNEGMTYTQMMWSWWAGADIISPDGTTVEGYFNSEANKEALQFFYDLHNTYKVAPTEDMQSAFAGEKVAMWINGPWMTNVWEENFPDFVDKWGAMPLPHNKAKVTNSGSWNIAITKQCKNKELAYKVLEALTNEEGAKIYCKESRNIPARKSILESEPMFSEGHLWEILNAQIVNWSKARPVTPVYPQISEALMDCYNALAFGQDVDSAMKEASAKMEKALKSVK